MNITTISRLLPYALMALVGLAGWSMESTALLAVVVLGTAGIAIGTTMANRPAAGPRESQSGQQQPGV